MNPSLVNYVAPVLALLISAFSVAFSYIKGRYDEVTGVRPALVFMYGTTHGWEVHNVGNGPALNVVVARAEMEGVFTNAWEDPVRIPPLKNGSYYAVHWRPDHDGSFGVSYEDMWGRPYTTVFYHERNNIHPGRHLLRWTEDQITPARRLRTNT